jgi:hypothetical protein
MLQEHTNGYSVLLATRELGDVNRDGIIETNLAFVVQDHDRGRGADDFGQGGEVVDGLGGDDLRAAPFPTQLPEALLPHRGSSSANDNSRTGIATGRNATFDDVVDLGEPLTRHADGPGGLHGKTTAVTSRDGECREQQEQHLWTPGPITSRIANDTLVLGVSLMMTSGYFELFDRR